MEVPDTDLFREARKVAAQLAENGFEVFFAGGCVRDLLLGREPNDLDLATSAHPEQVERLFRRTIAVGKQFGVIVVGSGEHSFEVATFRNDGAYIDGRRPVEVTFSTAREDVERRDFTINGLLMKPETGEVLDYVGGKKDLAAGVVRAIGDAKARFSEDRLRILRALRFATRLDFKIEAETAAAIQDMASHAADPSAERVFSEIDRLFCERDPSAALRILEEHRVLKVVLPEVARKGEVVLEERLQPSPDSPSVPRWPSPLDRLRFILGTLTPSEKPLPATVIWALMLDDLIDDYPTKRAKAARAVLNRLRAPKKLQQEVGRLIGMRDRLLFALRPSKARLKIVSATDSFAELMLFRELQLRASPGDGALEATPTPTLSSLSWTELPKPLLRGDEAIALGIPKGRALGAWLRRIRFLQLEGKLADHHDAVAYVKDRLATDN
ncbi:MAG: CCA tRNA nucleotidyltransferase [Planctomycetota bacterium]